MKKNISLSFLLVASTAVYYVLFGLWNGFRALFRLQVLVYFLESLFGLVLIIMPIILVALMHINTRENTKIDPKKAATLVCGIGGVVVIANLIIDIVSATSRGMDGLFDIKSLTDGLLASIFLDVVNIVVYFTTARRIATNNTNIKLKRIVYFILVLYSLMIVILNVSAALAGVSMSTTVINCIYLWGLCLMPMVFVDRSKVKNLTKIQVIYVVTMMVLIFILLNVDSLSRLSSGHKEPWEELGVSQSEYMDVYGYYLDHS